MPRLSFLGAGLLSLLTVAFPLHAETPLIGAEAVIELSDASDASSDYRFEPIAVTGQPFTEAVRVTVNRAADPVHLVQVWRGASGRGPFLSSRRGGKKALPNAHRAGMLAKVHR